MRTRLSLLVLALALAGASAAQAAKPSIPIPLIQPAELAAQLKDAAKPKPLLLHVGFKNLYQGGAIPGTVYAGPGAEAAGLKVLAAAVKKTPKNADIVIYCGCCPWEHCPNVSAASKKLVALGFKKVKALQIANDFERDWVKAGYPVEKPK